MDKKKTGLKKLKGELSTDWMDTLYVNSDTGAFKQQKEETNILK